MQIGTRKKQVASLLVLILAVCLVGGGYTLISRHTSKSPKQSGPVPAQIQKSVSFPVPYPLPSALPQGYTLDQASFSSKGQIVLYSVNYDQDKKIAFTVQPKPSEEDLKTFYTNQLSLRFEFSTDLGTAAVSALNDQTFASLPTKENSWVIATAPKDIEPARFEQVLKALRR